MTDQKTYSFVKNMPILSKIYKENLYDLLTSVGVDPNDGDKFPVPVCLRVRLSPYSTDDFFCPECMTEYLQESPLELAGGATSYYYTKEDHQSDTPVDCARCARRLNTEFPNTEIAEAVLRWTVSHLRDGGELQEEDWFDLWKCVKHIKEEDFELWDDVGYILTELEDLKHTCEK